MNEAFVQKTLNHLRDVGPLPFDHDEDPPPMTSIKPERDALMLLVKRGLAEIDYGDRSLDQQWVVRAKLDKPASATKADHLPYAVTPAILAMRARKLALGR